MAKIMSFVMAIFILVPVVAPSLGAAILAVASWRWVFGFGVIYAGLVALWSLRLPESLHTGSISNSVALPALLDMWSPTARPSDTRSS